MDVKRAAQPQLSADRRWWWDGSEWVPAGQARAQASRVHIPPWGQRLIESNRGSWRWVMLVVLSAAVALAGFDLVTGWEIPSSVPGSIVAFGLFVLALAACILILAFSDDERRAVAAEPDALKVAGVAARGVTWSSLFAIGISVVFFANCSANVTSGELTKGGATTNPAQFWSLAVWVIVPLIGAIALPAVFAVVAGRFAFTGRLTEATTAATLGLWSAALLAGVALATTAIALFVGASGCSLVASASSCAAGVGGLMNLTAIASLLVTVPYLVLLRRALSAASAGPDG